MNPYYTAIAQRADHRCEYCVELMLSLEYLRFDPTSLDHNKVTRI